MSIITLSSVAVARPSAASPVAVANQKAASAAPSSGPQKWERPGHGFKARLAYDYNVVFAHVMEFLGKLKPLRAFGYWLGGLGSKPHSDSAKIVNLAKVSPTLERGGQPTDEGFARLRKLGVNTVINLRHEENWEAPLVTKNGMKAIDFPIPNIGAPSMADATKFLGIVTDPANGKSYVHCYYGSDRTGAMVAVYRIAVQGWTPDRAAAELSKYGFHKGLENDKLQFIYDFAKYWSGLAPADRARILHQPAPNAQ